MPKKKEPEKSQEPKLEPKTVAAELARLFLRAAAANDAPTAAALSKELRAFGVTGLGDDSNLDSEREILIDESGAWHCCRCGQRLRAQRVVFRIVRDDPPPQPDAQAAQTAPPQQSVSGELTGALPEATEPEVTAADLELPPDPSPET
jgi:hypothetical protein